MRHDIEHRTLPASLYRESSVYAAEREKIFKRSWLYICHETQLPSAGHYVATQIAGYPLVAVRADDGAIRAFHNVCRHRAGPLVGEGDGICAGELVCRYHGWRYALDGRLKSARDFGPAPGFDPREYGLVSLRVSVWQGFVFASMEGEGPDLLQSVAPLDGKLGDIPLASYRFFAHTAHDLRCNWKTYVENYLEGYHIPLVHPELTDSIDCAQYQVDIDPPCVIHRAPPREGMAVNGLWAWIWPCLAINSYRNGVMMERISPVDHANTRLDYFFFFAPEMPREGALQAMTVSRMLVAEDTAICEAVQKNLDAGIYDTGRLSTRHEAGVAWFQQTVRQAIG